MIVAGTAAVLATGGLASQFFLARPGAAATEDKPGKASLNSGTKAPAEQVPAVAKVGKFLISEDTLAQECITRHGKEVLDDLINRAIIQQACEKQRVSVDSEEVEKEIEKIAKRFQLNVNEWQKMLQSERNITPQQYRDSVIWPMLALKKLAEGKAQDELSDAEVNKEFERQYGQRVKARMIMLDNFRRANECWDKCKKDPDAFDQLAQEYSVDPNSRSLGGAIPPIPRFSGNETIENVAFKMKEGAISAVIEIPTPAGPRYAILKCEGRTDQVVDSIEGVREQLVTELKERKVQENVAKVFEKIKAETPVRNFLTDTVSGPEPQSVNPAAKTSSGTAKSGIKQTSGEKAVGPSSANRPRTAAAGTSNKK